MIDTSTIETQAHEKRGVALASVAGAIFLTTLKLVVGLMTGSLGILAEAAHSLLDLLAALITLFAVHVSDRPPDATHLYGHGKVENLSALVETILLFATCGWIINEAINRLFFHPVQVELSIWAFVVMGVSIAVDFSRSRALSRIAKKYSSQALEADALHFSTDIWSSAVVILGLGLVWIGEQLGQKTILTQADAGSALVVALIVIYVSYQLGRRTVDALIDRAPDGLAEQMAAIAANVRSVLRVVSTRARQVGSQTFVEIRVMVPRHLSFEESHVVTRDVQDAVRAIAPQADVVVHAIPAKENEGVVEKIIAVAASGHYAVHNITTHLTASGMWVDLDLEVEPSQSFEHAHALATDLELRLRGVLGQSYHIADVNVHIEPREQIVARAVDLSKRELQEYVGWIETIQHRVAHTHGAQDIVIQKLNGKVYLALHLLVDANQTVAAVHTIAEEMENRLRGELPLLGRVVIHTEPFQVTAGKIQSLHPTKSKAE